MRFLGRMTASISHELKNVLAIINENASLASRAAPIEPARLERIAPQLRFTPLAATIQLAGDDGGLLLTLPGATMVQS